MENSLKGVLITATVALLFMTAMLNFMVLFPQEQGVSFSSAFENQTYLMVDNNRDLNLTTQLGTVKNQSESSFDDWDVTQGFMGSNTIKQGTKTGATGLSNNVLVNLKLMATQLFGQNSPFVYAITVITLLTSSILIYYVYKFVRTGL